MHSAIIFCNFSIIIITIIPSGLLAVSFTEPEVGPGAVGAEEFTVTVGTKQVYHMNPGSVDLEVKRPSPLSYPALPMIYMMIN